MAAKNKGKNNPSPASRPAVAKPKAAAPVKSAPLTHTFQSGFWREHGLASLILVGLSFALYSVSIGFKYVLDDQMVIWQNEYVQQGFGGLRKIFASDSFMGYFKQPQFLLEGGRYRPLSLATFAIEVGMFGKDKPYIGHFVNILWYGLTAVLMYRVLLGLFPLKPASEGGRWYFGLAFLASVLFVLHPLHSECVANIKGRDEILALFFSLGALYATLKYFDTDRGIWLVGSALSLLLAMLAKENALTFVAVIPLTVWFFTKVPNSRNFTATIPLLLAALAFILIRYSALGYMLNHGKSMNDLMNNPFIGMTSGERLATIFLTLGWYVKLLFVPHPLTHDYYPYHVPKVGWSDWRALASLALYLGMSAYALLNLRRRTVLAYCILFFLLTLSIVSNLFVSVGTFMNERFVFMPSVAFCLLAGWFLARKLPEWFKSRPDAPSILGAGLFVIVGGLYFYRTYTRVPDWKDALSLNTSALKVSPNSCRSHCFYVTAVYENIYLKQKTLEEKKPWVDTMEYHLDRAIAINPDYGSAWVMKGALCGARFEQDHQMDKLFHNFEIVLDHIPNNTNFRKYLDQYMVYLATSGGNPNKINAFAYRIGYERFYQKEKKTAEAIKFLEYGLMTQTDDERVLNSLAELYSLSGNAEKATEMKRRAEASSRD